MLGGRDGVPPVAASASRALKFELNAPAPGGGARTCAQFYCGVFTERQHCCAGGDYFFFFLVMGRGFRERAVNHAFTHLDREDAAELHTYTK